MNLQLLLRDIKQITRNIPITSKEFHNVMYYNNNNNSKHSIGVASLSEAELDYIDKMYDERETRGDISALDKWNRNRLKKYRQLSSDVDDDTLIKKVTQIVPAMKAYIGKGAHRVLFKESWDMCILPWLVTDIQYHQREVRGRGRDRYVIPEHVTINVKAYYRGEVKSHQMTYNREDLPSTPYELLLEDGYMIETDTSVEYYREQISRYLDVQQKVGWQMYAVGDAQIESGSDDWRRSSYTSTISMIRDDNPTKVIIDDLNPEDEKNSRDKDKNADNTVVKLSIWDKSADTNIAHAQPVVVKADDEEVFEDDEEMEGEVKFYLPIHPYLKCFDLDKHMWVKMHVENLLDYPWDDSLINKLILPDRHKKLINILMAQTSSSVEDIIKGKMAGVIVVATGVPGTGKTLTAEIFSESIKKALYVVQCSQLGLDVSSIESNLKGILARAQRWNAILAIDESDVYIRKRADDLQQNAIVGVFLRLIEYYRGIMFMTSNRGDCIDDAILSRATAWIKYELPDEDLSKQIWRVQATNYKIQLTDEDIQNLVDRLSQISGRSIRNILKLTNMLSTTTEETITVDSILEISDFQAIESKVTQ